MKKRVILESQKEIPVLEEVDVVVAGAGPAGIAAALAAAETGGKVMLLERHASPGGMATAALMSWFGGFYNGKEVVIRGIAEKVIKAIKEREGTKADFNQAWVGVDPEVMKIVVVDMLQHVGVRMLFHSWVSSAIMDDNKVKGVFIENKSGRTAIPAKMTIDCTGDGDVFARAGADFEKGDPIEHFMQPMSIVFRMSGVIDTELEQAKRADTNAEGRSLQKCWQKICATNTVNIPIDGFLHLNRVHPGEYNVHATRVLGVDGTIGEDLSRAEIEARFQAWGLFRSMKQNLPGCKNAYISQTPQQIGVRETRRLKGLYQLTADDVLGTKKFDDVIARGCYMIDLHNAKGAGLDLRRLKEGQSYDVPYGCLISEKIDNLLVAGRCISSTREANGSIRIMSMCMATGHAAGTAAMLAVQKNVLPRKLNVEKLQKKLRLQSANLGDTNCERKEK